MQSKPIDYVYFPANQFGESVVDADNLPAHRWAAIKEDVDIAFGTGVPARHGSKEIDAFNSETAQFVTVLIQNRGNRRLRTLNHGAGTSTI